MAVPDWPNTYGYNMFYFPFSQWIGGIFWEHSHRLVASLVGFMTLVLTIWSHGHRGRNLLYYGIVPLSILLTGLILANVDNNKWQHASITGGVGVAALLTSFFWPRMQPAAPVIRRLCWVALILVIGQGLLGGLRVTLYKDEIGIFHASLAQMFLVLMVSVAFVSSRKWADWPVAQSGKVAASNKFVWMMSVLCVLVVAQLVLGAFMRHQHAGLAVTGFPLAFDAHIWPPTDPEFINQLNANRIDHRDFNLVTALHVHVHMIHRCLAILLFMAGGAFLFWVIKQFGARNIFGKLSLSWFSLLCLQVVLGIATVLSNKAADIATAHVLIGALTLALGSFMVLAARRSLYLVQMSKTKTRSEAPSDMVSAPEVATAE